MSFIYVACLKATHVQVLHILWFILDLFLELSCNAFKAIFSYRPLSSSLVFFDTPFSFLCAHKNCCTHATSFTQRLVIQLTRSFLPHAPIFDVPFPCTFALLGYLGVLIAYSVFKVYDAINENPEAPNIDFPDDPDEMKAIIDFNACE